MYLESNPKMLFLLYGQNYFLFKQYSGYNKNMKIYLGDFIKMIFQNKKI